MTNDPLVPQSEWTLGSKEWYKFFDHILQQPEIPSGLDCLNVCQALCCPRNNMPGPRVGAFLIFLPFELEYIASLLKLDLANLPFKWQNIKLLTGETVAVPWTRCCPFIQGISCSIYHSRPLDCRTFPLMANSREGQLEFQINTDCPAYHNTSKQFRLYIRGIWEMVFPPIPQDWWDLLDELASNKPV